jgi:hypothetical protein
MTLKLIDEVTNQPTTRRVGWQRAVIAPSPPVAAGEEPTATEPPLPRPAEDPTGDEPATEGPPPLEAIAADVAMSLREIAAHLREEAGGRRRAVDAVVETNAAVDEARALLKP